MATSNPNKPNQDDASPERGTRTLAAWIIVGILLMLVPAMIGSIAYRSIMIHTPTTALVVGGDSSLEGAKIEVTTRTEPYKQWNSFISRYDDWQSPIMLDPGQYHIRVTHRDTEILSEDFAPDRKYGVRFDLPCMVLIIGSRSLSDARFEINYFGDKPNIKRLMDINLTAADHYRKAVYLMPGEQYRVTARSAPPGDQVLAQSDFFLDRITPVRVDLGKIYDEGE